MNKSSLDKVIYQLRSFHYSTELPVSIFNNEKCEFSIPKKIQSAQTIISNIDFNPELNINDYNLQITQNKYKEIILSYKIKNENCFIVVGPVLTEPIELGTITNMIRSGVIPFHQKTAIQSYYHNRLIISEDKLFYAGKLLEYIVQNFESTEIKNDSIEIAEEKKNDTYYKKKKEYRQNSFIHTPYIIEKEISKTISNGDTENAKLILKEMNATPHAKLASTTLRSLKNSMICSCAFISRAAIAGGVNPDEAFTMSDSFINNIEEIQNAKDLEKVELKMIEAFTDKVKNIKSQSYSNAVLNTIYYIENHLCEDLKIEQIAKSVYLNPSYLSSLFHKETGVTLNEWIKRKRIEEAAYYVLNSNESIADISFFYKFCSQSYFVNCFKKIIGVTPGEYRKKNKIEVN